MTSDQLCHGPGRSLCHSRRFNCPLSSSTEKFSRQGLSPGLVRKMVIVWDRLSRLIQILTSGQWSFFWLPDCHGHPFCLIFKILAKRFSPLILRFFPRFSLHYWSIAWVQWIHLGLSSRFLGTGRSQATKFATWSLFWPLHQSILDLRRDG